MVKFGNATWSTGMSLWLITSMLMVMVTPEDIQEESYEDITASYEGNSESPITTKGDSIEERKSIDIKEHPFIVSIRYRYENATNFSAVCGGCILAPSHVLTACHCIAYLFEGEDEPPLIYYPDQYAFVAGSVMNNDTLENKNVQIRQAKEFYNHARCSTIEGIAKYDLAMAEMTTPFIINDYVKPIPLIATGYEAYREKIKALQDDEKTVCEVFGWARNPCPQLSNCPDQTSHTLKIVRMYPINEEKCHNNVRGRVQIEGKPNPAFEAYNFTKHTQLCVISKHSEDNKNECELSSGSPYSCNGRLTAVMSYGEICAKETPMTYQMLSPMFAWIHKHMPDLAKSLSITDEDYPEEDATKRPLSGDFQDKPPLASLLLPILTGFYWLSSFEP